MSIQILSDLHLEVAKEYDAFEIIPKAPYLALLGDIGNLAVHGTEFLSFLTRQLEKFQAVLFVPGNHEAYHSSWPDTLSAVRKFETEVAQAEGLGKFVLMDRTAFQVPGTNTRILGCSLFSYVPPESEAAVTKSLNDFKQTQDWDVKMHNEAHKRDLAWLNEEVVALEGSQTEILIFTHWSPFTHTKAVEARHAGSPITSGFSTDLSEEPCCKSSNVTLWAFGHTHFNCDFEAKRKDGLLPLRIMANQRGYFSQTAGFDVGKVIEFGEGSRSREAQISRLKKFFSFSRKNM